MPSLLVFTLHVSPAALDWNADSAPFLAGLLSSQSSPLRDLKTQDVGTIVRKDASEYIKNPAQCVAYVLPHLFFSSYLKQYSLTALFMSDNGTYCHVGMPIDSILFSELTYQLYLFVLLFRSCSSAGVGKLWLIRQLLVFIIKLIGTRPCLLLRIFYSCFHTKNGKVEQL